MGCLLLPLLALTGLAPQQLPQPNDVLHAVRSPKWYALSDSSLAYPRGARHAVLSKIQRQHLYAWPAGSQIEFQTREETWDGLVLTGSLTLYSDGLASPAELGPWTYFVIPAGMNHKLACDPATVCVFEANFADPHNEVAALASKEALDFRQPAPFVLHLKQNVEAGESEIGGPSPQQESSGRPTAMSRPFFWGIGFATLWRYPKGRGALIVNPELYNCGLVLEGELAIEVDGVLAEPLQAGAYYGIPRKSSYRIDCRTAQCFVVARDLKEVPTGDRYR
jgi:hypothetical protein